MYAAPSSHKRRRAASRADSARSRLPGRIVVNVAGLPAAHGGSSASTDKGKARAITSANADTDSRLKAVIHSHCFNHALRVVFCHPQVAESSSRSSTSQLVESIQALAARASQSTCLARVHLRLFLNPEFVQQYVMSGRLVALSTGRLEVDDVICLDGQGTLLLHLTKATYQTLGLTGRPSHFSRTSSGRTGDRLSGPSTHYIVEIPLLDPTFRPGKPGWQRVHDCFEKWERTIEDGAWKMLFAHDGRTAIHFPAGLVREMDSVPVNCEVKTLEDIWCPSLTSRSISDANDDGLTRLARGWDPKAASSSSQQLDWLAYTSNLASLAEWSTLLELDSPSLKTFFQPPSLPINSYEAPEPSVPGTVSQVILSGFLHPSWVERAQRLVCKALHQDDDVEPKARWALLQSSGFSSSPIRWRTHEPGWGLAFGMGKSPADIGVGGAKKRKLFDQVKGPLNSKASSAVDLHGTEQVAKIQDNLQREQDLSDEEMQEDGDSDDESDDDVSDDDEDDDSDDDQVFTDVAQLSAHLKRKGKQTGIKARRKRARKVKRKGHLRIGTAERATMTGSSSSSSGGNENGWGMILFARQKSDGQDEMRQARAVWWENVEGDGRS